MSALFGCDAPECTKIGGDWTGGPPPPWVTITLEGMDVLEPMRTLHACSPAHAVSAVAEALGLEVDPGKVRP